ncbi:MAG: T9SS type A sorting domain-containing protein [Ignavibacteriales bacterium]|nr:T9SS type A sorting domain-containing protein [Ignavibacteriales bacterium]
MTSITSIKIIIAVFTVVVLINSPIYSQAILEADGPGNTYELINSVLAPGYDVVEHPECVHPQFGRHIAEVWDVELNQYVFEFYSHVTPDNDRCINYDRQRIEIKTYDQSPDSLIGLVGETVTYKWKFKLPLGFQPSSNFTHIHQIKPVDGDDGNPIFTLTPRKGSPNKLELIHNNITKVAIVALSLFEDVWVECTEVIFVDPVNGGYSMTIKKVNDGTTLLSYSNNNIMTIRPTNSFIRPKWGIYRSLLSSSDLRDEAVRFAGFYISEHYVLPVELTSFTAEPFCSTVSLNWQTATELNNQGFEIQRKLENSDWTTIGFRAGQGTTSEKTAYVFQDDISEISAIKFYYRLKQIDFNGTIEFSDEITVLNEPRDFKLYQNYPNPFNPSTTISYAIPITGLVKITIYNALGESIKKLVNETKEPGFYSINWNADNINSGVYFLKIETNNFISTKKMLFIK